MTHDTQVHRFAHVADADALNQYQTKTTQGKKGVWARSNNSEIGKNQEMKWDIVVAEEKSEELASSEVENLSKLQPIAATDVQEESMELYDEQRRGEKRRQSKSPFGSDRRRQRNRSRTYKTQTKARSKWHVEDFTNDKAFTEAEQREEGPLLMDTMMLTKPFRYVPLSFLPGVRELNYDLLKIPSFVTRNFNDNSNNWGGENFKMSIRLIEHILWYKVKILRKLLRHIPFQMVLLKNSNEDGNWSYPDEIIHKFCQLAGECGMDIFRVFDERNFLPNLILGIKAASKAGGIVETGISYIADLSDPSQTEYDIYYYLNLADELVKAGAGAIVIKDLAGLLTRSAATLLMSALGDSHPQIPIYILKQDTAGSGVACILSCAKLNDVVYKVVDSFSLPGMAAVVACFVINKGEKELSQKLDLCVAFWQQSMTSRKPSRYEKSISRAKKIELIMMPYQMVVERCLDYLEVSKQLTRRKKEIEAQNLDERNEKWVGWFIDVDLLEIILKANHYPKDFSTRAAIATNIDDIHEFLSKLLELNLGK